ncbi:hypothetical protein ANACOL_01427 [Anaerotruncus colihominis DSM 17241]|uniref:Uncharacterized protein n=1 Tax=Anaerotruncus colihominis DSM 17241 TaxID=445972 RepID=B0P9G0_9FIRM|nr:hypothetical protein ANACOL_01427 [Anaerotruncus colihominis DSM 17241]
MYNYIHFQTLFDKFCRIMYNITGVVTDGTPGHGPAIGGQPPARTAFRPKMAV